MATRKSSSMFIDVPTKTKVAEEAKKKSTAPELEVFAQQLFGVLRANAMTCDQLSTYYSIKYGCSLPEHLRAAAGSSDNARLEALKAYLGSQAGLFEFQGDRVKVKSAAEGISSMTAGWKRQTPKNPVAEGKKLALSTEIEKENQLKDEKDKKDGKDEPVAAETKKPAPSPLPSRLALGPTPLAGATRLSWADIVSDSEDEDMDEAEENRLDSYFKGLEQKREQFKTVETELASGGATEGGAVGAPATKQAVRPAEPKKELAERIEKDVQFVIEQLADLLMLTGHPIAHSSVLCSQFMHKHNVSVSDATRMKPMELFRSSNEFIWLSSGNVSLRKFENEPSVKQQMRLLQERPKEFRVQQAALEAQLPAPAMVTEQDVVAYFQRLISDSGAGSMYISALCGRFMQRFKRPVTAVVGCKPVDFFKKHQKEFVMEMGGHVRLGCPVPDSVLQELAPVPTPPAQAGSCEQPAPLEEPARLAEQSKKKTTGKAQSTSTAVSGHDSLPAAPASESTSTTASPQTIGFSSPRTAELSESDNFATPPQSPIRASRNVAAEPSPAKYPWRKAEPVPMEPAPARKQPPWRKSGATAVSSSPPAALKRFSENLKTHCCPLFEICQMVLDVGLWVEATEEYPDEAELVLFVEKLSRTEMPKMLNSVEELLRTHMMSGSGAAAGELHREGSFVGCVVTDTNTSLRIFLAPSYSTTEALRQAVTVSKARDRSILQPAFAKERQAFFKKHAGVGSAGRSAAVFLKTWSAHQLWSSKFTTPPTYLLRLIAAHVARQCEDDNCEEDGTWAKGLRGRVLEACSSFESLRLLWTDREMAAYSLSEVPEALLTQQPLVLDPVNSHHNVADPSSFDGFELVKFAKAALRGN